MKSSYIATGRSMSKWLKDNVKNFNADIFLVQPKGQGSRIPAIILQNGKLMRVELPQSIEKLTSWIPRFEDYFNCGRFTDKDYVCFTFDGDFIDVFECSWNERWIIAEKFWEKYGVPRHDKRLNMDEVPRPKSWKTINDV